VSSRISRAGSRRGVQPVGLTSAVASGVTQANSGTGWVETTPRLRNPADWIRIGKDLPQGGQGVYRLRAACQRKSRCPRPAGACGFIECLDASHIVLYNFERPHTAYAGKSPYDAFREKLQ